MPGLDHSSSSGSGNNNVTATSPAGHHHLALDQTAAATSGRRSTTGSGTSNAAANRASTTGTGTTSNQSPSRSENMDFNSNNASFSNHNAVSAVPVAQKMSRVSVRWHGGDGEMITVLKVDEDTPLDEIFDLLLNDVPELGAMSLDFMCRGKPVFRDFW